MTRPRNSIGGWGCRRAGSILLLGGARVTPTHRRAGHGYTVPMVFRTAASNLSLRQLRAFVTVAQESSMTRAATRLHLTPSALSMLVRGMEEELGLRLFERTTRSLALTDAGRELLPTVRQVFLQLEEGIARVQATQQSRAAQLDVGTSPLLASALVPRVIGSFRQQFPEVRVRLVDAPAEALATLVRDGDVDLAVATASSDYADLRRTRLHVDRLVLVCPPAHPLATRDEVPWHELRGQRLILTRLGTGLRMLVDDALTRVPGARRPAALLEPAYEVAQVATALGLVLAGEGVAPLPSHALSAAQMPVDALHLAAVPLVAPVIRRELVAIMRPQDASAPAVAGFIEHFLRVVGRG